MDHVRPRQLYKENVDYCPVPPILRGAATGVVPDHGTPLQWGVLCMLLVPTSTGTP